MTCSSSQFNVLLSLHPFQRPLLYKWIEGWRKRQNQFYILETNIIIIIIDHLYGMNCDVMMELMDFESWWILDLRVTAHDGRCTETWFFCTPLHWDNTASMKCPRSKRESLFSTWFKSNWQGQVWRLWWISDFP